MFALEDRNSPSKGKIIPNGFGKCAREGGPCNPNKTRGAKKERDLRPQVPETPPTASVNGSHEVSLTLIYPNPDQPRKFFPKDALEELALSIKEQGLIEPLVVVPGAKSSCSLPGSGAGGPAR